MDTFDFVGQADYGAVRLHHPFVILDNNVLSAIQSVCQRGYHPDIPEHRRAAHLLRWLIEHDVEYIDDSLAVIEGSGFHAGGLSSYGVLYRAMSIAAASRMTREQLEDFLAGGKPLGEVFGTDFDEATEDLLKTMKDALAFSVYPAYIVALQLRKSAVAGASVHEAVAAVMTVLSDELNYVPVVPWLTTLLQAYGVRTVKRTLRAEVLKTQKTKPDEVRYAVLSAGWDMGYLEQMRVWRAVTRNTPHEETHQRPVLVTGDKGLAKLAAMFYGPAADDKYVELDSDLVDPCWKREATWAVSEMVFRRAIKAWAVPRLEVCRQLIHRLEGDLGLAPSNLDLWLTVRLEFDPQSVLVVLSIVQTDNEKLLAEVERHLEHHDLLMTGFAVARGLLRDNAAARGRSDTDSLAAIAQSLRSRAGVHSTQLPAETLLAASVATKTLSFNAELERLHFTHGTVGPAILYYIAFIRATLADTGSARGMTKDALVALLRKKVTAWAAET
jgi:hypothetical protein